MRKTGIATLCNKCNEEFELFSDDGGNDSTLIWNYCPYCGTRNDLRLRFMKPNEANIKIGIGCKEAIELKDNK